MAKAFIPNPNNYKIVNHKDSNKQNNRVDNLEWCTQSYNVRHAIKHNPNIIKGMNNYNKFVRPKEIYQFNLDGKYINKYPNAKIASENTGVCSRNILQVARKEEYKQGKIRKQAGGYIWSFKKEGD